ncbi:MAG: hypothetical protein ACE5JL_09205 [Dehalococcoidia bacterium]
MLRELRRGDWRLPTTPASGAMFCGWFWEMWSYWAMPKLHYTIRYVEFAPLFETPLLGYAGCLLFGLEVFSAYYILTGLRGRVPEASLLVGESD